MAVLSSHLAPGFIRLTYEGTRLPHHQIIPIKFVDPDPVPGIDPQIYDTSGDDHSFTSSVENYVANALVPVLATGVRVGIADIYKVDAVTGVRTFVYTTNVNDLGENVNPTQAFSESVWMFKSSVGKPIKIYVMEAVFEPDSRNVGSVPADARQDVIDYVLGPTNIFYGRTDAWPLAFATFTSKINDVLRRNGGFSDV